MIRPSDVYIRGALPLTDTFGSVEREVAAAMLVLACRCYFDDWRPVLPRQVGLALLASKASAPWINNRVAMPDFFDLVKHGFARWCASPGGAIELTEAGIEKIRTSGWCFDQTNRVEEE